MAQGKLMGENCNVKGRGLSSSSFSGVLRFYRLFFFVLGSLFVLYVGRVAFNVYFAPGQLNNVECFIVDIQL